MMDRLFQVPRITKPALKKVVSEAPPDDDDLVRFASEQPHLWVALLTTSTVHGFDRDTLMTGASIALLAAEAQVEMEVMDGARPGV